jgi:Domain of unknown function (DUF3883)/SNF2-related domain
MAHLEELTRGATVKGILPDSLVTVVDVKWHGSVVVELTYKDASGRLGSELLYRDREPTIDIAAAGRPWSFDGEGSLFRLVSEAYRIRLAYLFDPLLAVHTSLVDPLPHQITGVYGEMLTRQPLRFLLADDPGAGKTIMTGLLVKELLIRGDLHRCLIVCPGMLVEQWQDELDRRFHLPFEIMTTDALEAARTGNWFLEHPLAICRLDKLSRDEDVQAKLEQTDWDLIVVDEAHKLSASFFAGEIRATKRYRLGQMLSRLTRHFLLLTATPHNGKDEDFQLFMAVLDGDRPDVRARLLATVDNVAERERCRELLEERALARDAMDAARVRQIRRAEDLKTQEAAGRQPRINWQRARQRADDLQARLQRRMTELEQERHLSPLPPVVVGGGLVVPAGLLARLQGQRPQAPDQFAHDTERVARLAMAAVMDTERALGYEPYDISREKRGYDIESRVPGTGRLRFIEVKGRVVGAQTVTVTKNEILTALNKPDDFILAVVLLDGETATPRYIRHPFQRKPDFGVTSVNYDVEDLLARAENPS